MPSKADPIVADLHKMLGGSTINADEYKTITIVIKPEDMSAINAGHQARIYYSSPTVNLSESNTVRTGWPSKTDADGTVTLTFKMNSNATWRGEMDFLRFDPFDLLTGFSVVSISFAP